MSGPQIPSGEKVLVRWFGGQIFGVVRNVSTEYEELPVYGDGFRMEKVWRSSMSNKIEIDAVDGSTVILDTSRVGDVEFIQLAFDKPVGMV